MKRLIAWAIGNGPGMNVLMIAVMLIGGLSLYRMRREVFPEFELEVVMVTVAYPGATPKDCEVAICQKIEESVRSINGIKKVTSIAREGGAFVLCELRSDVPSVQKVLGEIDREVNRIPSFPDLAEDPEIQQITFRDAAIRVGIIGPDDRTLEGELKLREVAEGIRDDILTLSSVSAAEIMGTRPYQIDVEIPESTLRSHGLTLDSVAAEIRSRNIELPGGQMKTQGQEILLRAKNKSHIGEEIAQIPLVTRDDVVLTVNDLGVVIDGFDDSSSIGEINGEPAMVVNVLRSKSEDLLAMVTSVREYVEGHELPPGYRFEVWNDSSTEVRGRLELLQRNGLQGLLLVFLVLTMFLDMRLAFWVALGIPISILGAGIFLGLGDQTLNMLSLFSFLVALGIVVDDAIVIGENIHAHRQMGKSFHQAAVDGTVEVFGSVTASVMTTVIAFSPMFFVSGVMGKFMAVIPFAVIAMLLLSLWESIFVLPSHLAHPHKGFFKFLAVVTYPLRPIGLVLSYCSKRSSRGLEGFCDCYYVPALRFVLKFPLLPCGILALLALSTIGLVTSGIVPRIVFPKVDNNFLQAVVVFPDGTPVADTNLATQQMERALRDVSREIAEERATKEKRTVTDIYGSDDGVIAGPVRLTYREVGNFTNTQNPAGGGGSGSAVGQIFAELYDTEIRDVHSKDLIARWRQRVGEIAGAESVTYGTVGVGPGGKPIEFKLLASSEDSDALQDATEEIKAKLETYLGVFDIADDNTPGKWEYQFKVQDQALATGIDEAQLGRTVRNTYFGAEAMRLQRGRHEVKLMVRYPKEERESLVNFREIRVSDQNSNAHPIHELAEVTTERGFSEINRVDQKRSITITADIDESSANATDIIAELQASFVPELIQRYKDERNQTVEVRWEGQAEQSRESVGSLMIGFLVAIVAMYVLLVIQFRSYVQPILILLIVPFGFIGAVWGHALLGLPLTLFSMFGLVALSGVVINDSIVLIDFINARARTDNPSMEALVEAGRRRFRPILLTSMTTIAGLIPLMLERSFQAQLLIPMAASLAFGLLLATSLVLFLVPVSYSIYLRGLLFLRGFFSAEKAVPATNAGLAQRPGLESKAI